MPPLPGMTGEQETERRLISGARASGRAPPLSAGKAGMVGNNTSVGMPLKPPIYRRRQLNNWQIHGGCGTGKRDILERVLVVSRESITMVCLEETWLAGGEAKRRDHHILPLGKNRTEGLPPERLVERPLQSCIPVETRKQPFGPSESSTPGNGLRKTLGPNSL